jgi:hypothetical protein
MPLRKGANQERRMNKELPDFFGKIGVESIDRMEVL